MRRQRAASLWFVPILVALIIYNRSLLALLPSSLLFTAAFGALLVNLILDALPLGCATRLEFPLERSKIFAISVHANETLEELDLVGPDLLVLDGLAFVVLLVNGRLKDHGHATEAVLVHDAVESTQAEEAGADIGVQISIGSKRGLAIVYCDVLACE